MSKHQTIAIVDDDPLMRSALADLLSENGFKAQTFSNSGELNNINLAQFDLFLIDLRLGNENGLDVMSMIHQSLNTPVIMLSGVGDEIDKTIGLEAGADDYISKPFNPRELIARVRALMRRYNFVESASVMNSLVSEKSNIKFGDFVIDTTNRLLLKNTGEEVHLSNGEYRLLEYLFTNHNRVIDRTELLNYLGSDLSEYVERTVDVLILRLRGKIEASPSKPVFLQTRRGRGYVFVLPQA